MGMEGAFRDAMPRARWVRRLLWLMIAGNLVALAADGFERSVLARLQARDFASAEAFQVAATWSDRLQAVTGAAQVVLLMAAYILGGMWIVQVARNVRALGARDLEISPGWAVGWYAVPVGNLFKPFHAMQEIWCASVSAARWREMATPGWLRLWWGCWLVSNVLGQAALRLTLRAKGVDELLLANSVSMVQKGADIVLCAAFALVVARVTAAQNAQWLAGAIPQPRESPTAGDPLVAVPPALPET